MKRLLALVIFSLTTVYAQTFQDANLKNIKFCLLQGKNISLQSDIESYLPTGSESLLDSFFNTRVTAYRLPAKVVTDGTACGNGAIYYITGYIQGTKALSNNSRAVEVELYVDGWSVQGMSDVRIWSRSTLIVMNHNSSDSYNAIKDMLSDLIDDLAAAYATSNP